MNRRKSLSLKDAIIDDPFWNRYLRLVTMEMIPYQYRMLNDRIPDAPPSRCIRNLRIAAGLEKGDFEGFPFQDTDLAKWLEAVAYSLAFEPNPELEQTADEMILLLNMAQQENGYLNSYFTIRHPGKQFCNLRDGHELYTAGHFIEAAVAYWQVTGKDEFLKMMCACADHICWVFREHAYRDAVPGHEEIELALIRLADATGKKEYRDMALEFVNRRGCTDYLVREHELERFVDVWPTRAPYIPEYSQSHKPVREQTTAEGHAVRAIYLYCAMADLAEDDEQLLHACERLYENITKKRMYITGGVGSSGFHERFTTDYDLPNDFGYSESCASVALAMFCRRMARLTGEARYMDTAELALMNTVLAGVAVDGKSFFYVNPLEVVPGVCMPGTGRGHVMPRRQKWFGCACCPPNIARTLASLGEYVLFRDDNTVWMNLYIGSRYRMQIGQTPLCLQVRSGLPYRGRVSIKTEMPEGAIVDGHLMLRIPEYARSAAISVDGRRICPQVEKGYAAIPLRGNAYIELSFEMPAELIYANPRVFSDVGKCAVKKGPLIYCLEETDNGDNLAALYLDNKKMLQEFFDKDLLGGTMTILAEGWRLDRQNFSDALYRNAPAKYTPCRLRFLPYFLWANREPGEMSVWIRYRF